MRISSTLLLNLTADANDAATKVPQGNADAGDWMRSVRGITDASEVVAPELAFLVQTRDLGRFNAARAWLASHVTSSYVSLRAGEAGKNLRTLAQVAQLAADALAQSASGENKVTDTDPPKDNRVVFVIHGRNLAAKHAMDAFLRRLDLRSRDWDELLAEVGGTPFVGEVVERGLREAQAVIALFTPDEWAELSPHLRSAHDKPEDIGRWQARPNVIFEAGMAFGIDSRRTILVALGHNVGFFSDVSGRHVLRLDNNEASRRALRLRLKGAGCPVDESALLTGPEDFEACVPKPGQAPRTEFDRP